MDDPYRRFAGLAAKAAAADDPLSIPVRPAPFPHPDVVAACGGDAALAAEAQTAARAELESAVTEAGSRLSVREHLVVALAAETGAALLARRDDAGRRAP